MSFEANPIPNNFFVACMKSTVIKDQYVKALIMDTAGQVSLSQTCASYSHTLYLPRHTIPIHTIPIHTIHLIPYTHTHKHTHMHTHTHIHLCTYTLIHIYTHTYTHIHI